MRRRLLIIIASTAALYAVLLGVVWDVCTRQAQRKTEQFLDYAVMDFKDTIRGALETMLTHICEEMVRHFGVAKPVGTEEMQHLAELCEVDELNIIAKNGEVLASNLDGIVGYNISTRPDSAAFLILTDGKTQIFSHPFRPSANNPLAFRKFSGAAFPGGDGLVQVGIDELHLARMFPIILGSIFDKSKLGDTGFFLYADIRDGRLIPNRATRQYNAANIADTGFSYLAVPRSADKVTCRQRVFGMDCDCRVWDFAAHRVIIVIPTTEFYSTRSILFAVLAILMFAILGGFAFFINRAVADAERIRLFYAAEERRRRKDMDIAKTIQTSALPAELPHMAHCSLHASMEAARDVGGDFYDYFPVGPTSLAFLVADVSGKGITAALYMMTAKTLLKDTLLSVHDPAAAVSQTNEELCRSNPANMFLTAWVGVLDFETGVVTYVNAGHNPPILLQNSCLVPSASCLGSDAAPPTSQSANPPATANCKLLTANPPATANCKLLTANLKKRSGPALAFMSGVEYKAHTVQMNPGDTLFLYTDGVTEAMDCTGNLFGDPRLAEALQSVPALEPAAVCKHVRSAVASFAEGAEQADDITLLAIQCTSLVRRIVRTFPPTQDGLVSCMQFLDETLDAENCPMDVHTAFNIILDEIGSNIIKFSGASGFELDIEPIDNPRAFTLVFIDDGAPYDPLTHVDPDTTLSAEDRPIGGLGILMVKRLATSVFYRREHNRNFLTITKRIQ